MRYICEIFIQLNLTFGYTSFRKLSIFLNKFSISWLRVFWRGPPGNKIQRLEICPICFLSGNKKNNAMIKTNIFVVKYFFQYEDKMADWHDIKNLGLLLKRSRFKIRSIIFELSFSSSNTVYIIYYTSLGDQSFNPICL